MSEEKKQFGEFEFKSTVKGIKTHEEAEEFYNKLKEQIKELPAHIHKMAESNLPNFEKMLNELKSFDAGNWQEYEEKIESLRQELLELSQAIATWIQLEDGFKIKETVPYKAIEVRSGAESKAKEQKVNEDSFVNKPREGVFAIFDGMGGHAQGEVASSLAKEGLEKQLAQLAEEGLPPEQIKIRLTKILEAVNYEIFNHESQQGLPDDSSMRMGTTASVVKIWEGESGERKAIIGNIGDSRVYVCRKSSGELEQITADEGPTIILDLEAADKEKERTEKMLEKGMLGQKPGNESKIETLQQEINGLNEELQRIVYIKDRLENIKSETELEKEEETVKSKILGLFKNRNIVWSKLGAKQVKPKINVIDLNPGDRLLLTSDGVHDNLAKVDLDEIMKKGEKQDAGALSKEIVSVAFQVSQTDREQNMRAKEDDITAIVVDIPVDIPLEAQKIRSDEKAPIIKQEAEEPRGPEEKLTQNNLSDCVISVYGSLQEKKKINNYLTDENLQFLKILTEKMKKQYGDLPTRFIHLNCSRQVVPIFDEKGRLRGIQIDLSVPNWKKQASSLAWIIFETEETEDKEKKSEKPEEEIKKEQPEIQEKEKVEQEKPAEPEAEKLEQVADYPYLDGLFTGYLDKDKLPQGEGVFRDADGNVYRGEFEKGEKHGIGRMVYRDGQSEFGKWEHGKYIGEKELDVREFLENMPSRLAPIEELPEEEEKKEIQPEEFKEVKKAAEAKFKIGDRVKWVFTSAGEHVSTVIEEIEEVKEEEGKFLYRLRNSYAFLPEEELSKESILDKMKEAGSFFKKFFVKKKEIKAEPSKPEPVEPVAEPLPKEEIKKEPGFWQKAKQAVLNKETGKVIGEAVYKTVGSVLGFKFVSDLGLAMFKKGDIYSAIKGKEEIKEIMGAVNEYIISQSSSEMAEEAVVTTAETMTEHRAMVLREQIEQAKHIAPEGKQKLLGKLNQILEEHRVSVSEAVEARNRKLQTNVEVYLTKKVSEVSIARDAFNTLLTGTGMVALRGAMYAGGAVLERVRRAWAEYKQKKAEKPEDKTSAITHILKDVMLNSALETASIGFWSKQEKRTTGKKIADIVQSLGAIARGFGIYGLAIAEGQSVQEGIEKFVSTFEQKGLTGAMADNFVNNAGKMIDVYTHPGKVFAGAKKVLGLEEKPPAFRPTDEVLVMQDKREPALEVEHKPPAEEMPLPKEVKATEQIEWGKVGINSEEALLELQNLSKRFPSLDKAELQEMLEMSKLSRGEGPEHCVIRQMDYLEEHLSGDDLDKFHQMLGFEEKGKIDIDTAIRRHAHRLALQEGYMTPKGEYLKYPLWKDEVKQNYILGVEETKDGELKLSFNHEQEAGTKDLEVKLKTPKQ